MITKDITIEELVEKHQKSIEFLRERGIRCIRCGEPIWGTLEEAAKEKGFPEDEIDKITADLIEYLEN